MPRKRKALARQESFKTAVSCGLSGNIKEKPQQRNAANARERARMRVLSRAFCRLKTTLPWVPADTKLSKLDTLRLASSYIAHLKGILREDPFSPQEPLHPAINLTWPFGFNRGGVGGGGTGSNGSGRGGGSASVSDDGDGEGEESDSNSDYWREVAVAGLASNSNSKDCIHLDPSTRYDDEDATGARLVPAVAVPMYRHFSVSVAAMHLHSHSHDHQQINTSDVSSGLESNGLEFQ